MKLGEDGESDWWRMQLKMWLEKERGEVRGDELGLGVWWMIKVRVWGVID